MSQTQRDWRLLFFQHNGTPVGGGTEVRGMTMEQVSETVKDRLTRPEYLSADYAEIFPLSNLIRIGKEDHRRQGQGF